MSLFKYGNLEVEIDFTDVDFLENLDEAKKLMVDEAAHRRGSTRGDVSG